jgi:hypothetical protein
MFEEIINLPCNKGNDRESFERKLSTGINVHKFSTVSEETIKSLESGEVWFSDPEGFNDPYDCNLNVNSELTLDEIKKYMHLIAITYGWELPPRSVINDFHLNQRVRFSEIYRKEIKNYGISCFSLRDDSLLMWSHYADKHKGMCLTFNTKRDELFFKGIFPVLYTKQYPEFNIAKEALKHNSIDQSLAINSMFFMLGFKSIDWLYEKELRLVRQKQSDEPFRGLVKFNKLSLIDLKFGTKTSDDDIYKVCKILSSLEYNHVRIWRARLSNFEFKIEYDPIIIKDYT